MGYLPEVLRVGEKDSTNQRRAETGQGMGGGERRGLEGGQGRNEEKRKKEKPSSAPCRIVHAQPFNLLSAFSCRGENVTLA